MPEPTDNQELLEVDPEYSRLHEEHKECERRLVELHHQASLSEDDELAAKQIKRHKLFLKDRMEEIARNQVGVGALA